MRIWIGAGLALVLFFVWSVPGVPALRNVLFLASLLLLARKDLINGGADDLTVRRGPLLWLLLLTLWWIVQALVISPKTDWALGELTGQWGKALLAGLLGVLIARASLEHRGQWGRWFTAGLLIVATLQAATGIGQAIDYWFAVGEVLRQVAPITGGKLEMSFVLNILIAGLLVDIFARLVHRRRFLPIPAVGVLIMLVIALIEHHLAGARNGMFVLVLLAFVVGIVYVASLWTAKGARFGIAVMLLVVAVMGAFVTLNFRADERWLRFAESLEAGWDIDANLAWRDPVRYAFPAMENGDGKVDESAYTRVALIHAGLRIVAEQPLGVGYGRNAFKHALALYYPDGGTNVGHAHSGWVDLAIAGGWPAVVMWAALMVTLIRVGWRRYSREKNLHALFLVLLVIDFSSHMVIDTINRDHMLQMFFFLAGYLLIRSREREDENAS